MSAEHVVRIQFNRSRPTWNAQIAYSCCLKGNKQPAAVEMDKVEGVAALRAAAEVGYLCVLKYAQQVADALQAVVDHGDNEGGKDHNAQEHRAKSKVCSASDTAMWGVQTFDLTLCCYAHISQPKAKSGRSSQPLKNKGGVTHVKDGVEDGDVEVDGKHTKVCSS